MASAKPKVENSLIPVERIASRISLIRGKKVMLDADLAAMYGVLTNNLNLAVRRNERRFRKISCSKLSALWLRKSRQTDGSRS